MVGDQQGVGGLGSARLLTQAVQTLAVEGVDGVADGDSGAAEVAGDPGRAVAGGTGQQDLATAQRKSLGRTQASLQTLAFARAESANEQ